MVGAGFFASGVSAYVEPYIDDLSTATPTVGITATSTVRATDVVHTPTQTPQPTNTPTPTATLSLNETYATEAVEVTANYKVERCLQYKEVVERWITMEKAEHHEFWNLGVAEVSLVLSVGAAESGCDQTLVSYAGAVGIMQVIPRPWLPIQDVSGVGANIYVGMWILDRSITKYDTLRLALAHYNCSEENVANDMCGPTGGVHYADHVLEFWLPRLEEALGPTYYCSICD